MADLVAVREFQLWTDNTYELYLRLEGIAKGIKKAKAKGTYDVNKAEAACRRLGNESIKHYKKTFGEMYVSSDTRGHLQDALLDEALDLAEEL